MAPYEHEQHRTSNTMRTVSPDPFIPSGSTSSSAVDPQPRLEAFESQMRTVACARARQKPRVIRMAILADA